MNPLAQEAAPDMIEAQEKVVQYLSEAHAMELAGVQAQTAHLAVAPVGPYRSLLERHLDETRDQTRRLEERLSELGQSRNPLQVTYGLVQNVVGQVLAIGKTPIDLLRGSGGEEKLLKNAKDDITAEALEIGTYDALEALAEGVGDDKTAVLARETRTQEELQLKHLRELLPELTAAVVAADVHGEYSYDPSKTAAADAVRQAQASVRKSGRRARNEAKARAGAAGAAGRAAAKDAGDAAKGAAQQAEQTVEATAKGAAAQAAQTAQQAGGKANEEARKVPGEEELEGEARGTVASADDLPIADYDSLNANEVVAKLRTLSELDLAKVDGYEREHRARKRVLATIEKMREGATA